MEARRRGPRRRLLVILAILAGLVIPSAALASHFVDVGANDVHAPGIEYLADTGITLGCATNPDRFCPNDELTRAQMGSFLFRASGHDPSTPPSVNAAELDGRGPSAYTTDVSSAQRTSSTDPLGGVIVTVLTIEDLPAGQYVISGNVLATGQAGTTESMVMCSVHVGTAMAGRSLAMIGTDPGHVLEATLPLAGRATITTPTADLEVRCNAPSVAGDGTLIAGGELPVTQVIATRVGDADGS
jgi:hypothetical protein